MAQLAAYTRMKMQNATKLLAAAIPVRRLFRASHSRLQSFLNEQIDNVIIDAVDGDAIIATGLILEMLLACEFFKSDEPDLDSIAESLSRRGGEYWFFTSAHRDVFLSMRPSLVKAEDVLAMHKRYSDFVLVDLDAVNASLKIFQESVAKLPEDEVVLWSVA